MKVIARPWPAPLNVFRHQIQDNQIIDEPLPCPESQSTTELYMCYGDGHASYPPPPLSHPE